MTAAEFEEREFETPLYSELRCTDLVWSPGQVLEGRVGFDYAALSLDPRIWELQGYSDPPIGIYLSTMYAHWSSGYIRLNRVLPDFQLNLFLQAKRPDHMKRLVSHLKGAGLSSPYWRFVVTPDQQGVLEALAHHAGAMALVSYASAAFHRLTQLYAHITAGTVLENSTFPRAELLSGHAKWNYDAPGSTGVANARPEFIEEPSLLEQLEQLVSQESDSDVEPYEMNLRRLAASVLNCAEELFNRQPSRVSLFLQRVSTLQVVLEPVIGERTEPIRDFLIVQAFCKTFGLQWFTVGRKWLG